MDAGRTPGPCVQRPSARAAGGVHPADDDERCGLSRPVVRDRPAEGDDERLGDHRDVPGHPLPGTAYVLLHHYIGEIDGVLRAWGIPRGGTGGVSASIANAARSFGVEIRTESPVEQFVVNGDEVIGAVTSS